MKNKNEFVKLIMFLIIIFIILGGFLIYVSAPLLGTKTAVLSTLPIDPFDPIRGQYIIIRYDIGNIPSIPSAQIGNTVYVVLENDAEGISRYKSASLEKPSDDELFIKGEIQYVSADSMNVEYGIEQYFFERGGSFTERVTEVEARLSDSGSARIVNLLNNGNPIEIKSREVDYRS